MAELLSGLGESMRTMNWKTVRGTLLVVHTNTPPDDSEWAAFIRDTTAIASTFDRVMVFADITLSAEQRRQVTAVNKAAGSRAVAIITSSSLARMVVTALSWMHRGNKAFDPADVGAAFDYLELDDAARGELLATALEFARQLNNVRLAEALVPH